MSEKEKFLKNYKGTLNPEIAYNMHVRIEKAKSYWNNATFSESYNKRMLNLAINQIRSSI